MKAIHSLLERYFWIVLGALTLIFFLSIAAGATWGLPALWQADEVIHQVMPALNDGLDSITLNIFYPTLPFFSMYATGKLLAQVTADEIAIKAGMRILSAALAALVVLLSALMTLTAGRSRTAALVAALLVMFGSGFVTIAHHAIVDIYLTFFMALAAFLLLRFVATRRDLWLYLGFLAIGLAASSKYNGASLLLAATILPFLLDAPSWRGDLPRAAARLGLAYLLAFLGFFAGTPRDILAAPSHFGQLIPLLQRQSAYAGPRSMGLIGQWGRVLDGLGPLLFLLFALAVVWAVIQAWTYFAAEKEKEIEGGDGRYSVTLLLILTAFELPLAFSQFYPMRYMVPAYPLTAVLAVMMLEDLWRRFAETDRKAGQWMVVGVTTAVLFFSALRYASVLLIYANDSRTLASDALPALIEPGSRTEFTLYPPHLPQEARVVDDYPLRVFKFEEDIETITGWNMGEEGVELRKPDYLVVDRKTYERFDDEFACALNPVECAFFNKLLNGETNYELVQAFDYAVPPFLPDVKTDHANIEVLLYARRAETPVEEAAPEQAINAAFGPHITLRGYDLAQPAVDQLALTLYWATTVRLAEDYKVFVHCLDEAGQILAQSDSNPAGGSAPTSHWLRGELVADAHLFELPPEWAPDACRLYVGLYAPQTGERLPALLDGAAVQNDAVPLRN